MGIKRLSELVDRDVKIIPVIFREKYYSQVVDAKTGELLCIATGLFKTELNKNGVVYNLPLIQDLD